VILALPFSARRPAEPCDHDRRHEPARALGLAEALFARLAAERVAAPRLARSRARRRRVAARAGDPLAPPLVDLLDAQRNPIFAPIALATLWPIQIAFAIEAWRRRHGARVAEWLDLLGELEALVALGTYTIEHPATRCRTSPTAARGSKPRRSATRSPGARCVRNDVALDATAPVLVVSGSNMSGKSTLLRSRRRERGARARGRAGARGAAPALAARDRGLDPDARLAQRGTSRFYAEITRIRSSSTWRRPRPLLFLLDEILHGTNSHDRRIGAEAIVRGLSGAARSARHDARPRADDDRRRSDRPRPQRPLRRSRRGRADGVRLPHARRRRHALERARADARGRGSR
jgi:hypothetical protein